MKRFFILCILLVFSLKNYAQNIINGDFENGFLNWVTVGGAQFSVDNNAPHSGTASGKISSNLPNGSVAAFGQNVPGIIGGRIYEYEYWARIDSTLSQYIYSYVKFQNDTSEVYLNGNTPFVYQPGWVKVKYRFKAPEHTNNVLLGFCILGQGDVWFDDVSLTEIKDTTYNSFAVELKSDTGVFKKLFSTNVGPVNNAYIPKFQEMGIDYVRTHDYHTAFDFHVIFPDTSKSTSDSLAYDFGSTDSAIVQIINSGCKVFYRLGESYGYVPAYFDSSGGFEKWGQVAVQIIKHYNDGWNNGFHYNIQYWEIWNEPNLPEFWSLGMQDYIHFYSTLANTIKQYNPGLKVGGPTLSTPYETRWMNSFLDSIYNDNVPLDFLSFHWYDYLSPYGMCQASNHTRQIMDEKGFGRTELILDEWNPYRYIDSISNASNWARIDALNSATTVSCFNYLQGSGLDKLFRYATDMYDFPLLQWNGNYTYQGYAYKILNQLASLDVKLATVGSDTLGTTIMAARSVSDFSAVIADNSSKASGYFLAVNNIDSNENWAFRIFRLDSANEYVPVKTGVVTSLSNVISVPVISPYVDNIEFSKVTGVNGLTLEKGISIYPNPATRNFILEGHGTISYLSVLDFAGKTVFTQRVNSNKVQINLANVSAGFYEVIIRYENGDFGSEKLVIERED